ncbi:hypothetical protein U0070_008384 [Myodes glareolus]|uniref:Uncharacterized protein n=1 Tax=Myodes glareolus TaxID=447135 RepID=A0AAW0IYA8_MYOGA
MGENGLLQPSSQERSVNIHHALNTVLASAEQEEWAKAVPQWGVSRENGPMMKSEMKSPKRMDNQEKLKAMGKRQICLKSLTKVFQDGSSPQFRQQQEVQPVRLWGSGCSEPHFQLQEGTVSSIAVEAVLTDCSGIYPHDPNAEVKGHIQSSGGQIRYQSEPMSLRQNYSPVTDDGAMASFLSECSTFSPGNLTPPFVLLGVEDGVKRVLRHSAAPQLELACGLNASQCRKGLRHKLPYRLIH